MSEHILKSIEELEAKALAHEREILKIRTAINSLCEISGLEPKYQVDSASQSPAGNALAQPVKPDQFYGKPLATAVREALVILRNAGRAPASVETIYDLLEKGGYDFGAKAEAAIQSLSISIGKNSALFVKLNNGLIGVKDWYENAPRRRAGKKTSNGDGTQGATDSDNDANPADENDGVQSPEGGAS